MHNRIRSARKAKSMTLTDVAKRCTPPTTAQTIGRLETGARTLSIDWLNRIADAIGVDSAQLVQLPDQEEIELAAVFGVNGVYAPKKIEYMSAETPTQNMIAIRMSDSIGDYRHGDILWLEKTASNFKSALNMDVLVPRPEGRFIFGRLIGHEGDKVQILPLDAGGRQQIIKNPQWIAKVRRLTRSFP